MTDGFDLERYYDLRLVTDVAVSPTGDRVAFVVDEFDGDADDRRHSLFVAPTDGSRDPHRLTRVADASSPAFSPDGERLGFVGKRTRDVALDVGSTRATDDGGDDDGDGSGGDGGRDVDGGADGDDEPEAQLWVFDLERGGDARQVTTFEQGVREFDWGPGGDRVVVSARDPTEDEQSYLDQREDGGPIETERLQHKRDGAGWLDTVTTYLFVVDVESREDRRLEAAYGAGSGEPLSGLQPAWGPGDRIAFVSNHGERPDDSMVMDLFTIAPDGSDLRRLTDSDLTVSEPAWSPDGTRIGFVGGHPTNWYRPSEVYVAEADTYRSVSASLDRTIGWAGNPCWLDDDTLLAPFADGGWTRLVRLEADADDPERVFEGQGRNRNAVCFDAAGGTVGLALSSPADGLDVHAVATEALADPEADGTRLSSLNADLLEDVEPPETRRVTVETGDDQELEAIVYLPGGADADAGTPGASPLVVSIHGGPMSYDAPEFRFDVAYWTNRGYVVAKPNYRGSTSYGRAFSEQLRGSRGDLESEDVVRTAEALVDRGWVDPERLFVTGFSYGGITTAHVVTRTDTFAAAAPEHGIYDFYSLFGTDDNHLWHEDEFGLPWENLDRYREISSLTDVGEIETPLLVTAGGQDWRCPPTQAEQLYVSVKKRGVPAKLVVYPDEHHNVGDPDRAVHRLRELTAWFERFDPARE